MRKTLLLFALAPLAVAQAADRASPKHAPLTVSYFFDLQEQPPFTPAEMAERHADPGEDPEGAAADRALNDWKLCVLDGIQRWADLKPGPGTLIDGAYGRCADVARQYRQHLIALKLADIQLSRTMTRSLEESWRPRLVAAVLDQELAKATATPAKGAK